MRNRPFKASESQKDHLKEGHALSFSVNSPNTPPIPLPPKKQIPASYEIISNTSIFQSIKPL